jgi:D-3-phosphoglycerate dehydrogenase
MNNILGASTAEAQTRVAIEIAEQFLAISGKSKIYPITGIVNAPVMAATANADNRPWIELASRLGQIIGKLVDIKSNVNVESHTKGPDLAKENFIGTAIQVGILANHAYEKLNLINASDLAKERGIQINATHENTGQNAIVIKAGAHTIKGLTFLIL